MSDFDKSKVINTLRLSTNTIKEIFLSLSIEKQTLIIEDFKKQQKNEFYGQYFTEREREFNQDFINWSEGIIT